jgi:hypothetical protein
MAPEIGDALAKEGYSYGVDVWSAVRPLARGRTRLAGCLRAVGCQLTHNRLYLSALAGSTAIFHVDGHATVRPAGTRGHDGAPKGFGNERAGRGYVGPHFAYAHVLGAHAVMHFAAQT